MKLLKISACTLAIFCGVALASNPPLSVYDGSWTGKAYCGPVISPNADPRYSKLFDNNKINFSVVNGIAISTTQNADHLNTFTLRITADGGASIVQKGNWKNNPNRAWIVETSGVARGGSIVAKGTMTSPDKNTVIRNECGFELSNNDVVNNISRYQEDSLKKKTEAMRAVAQSQPTASVAQSSQKTNSSKTTETPNAVNVESVSQKSSSNSGDQTPATQASVKWTGKKIDSVKEEIEWSKINLSLDFASKRNGNGDPGKVLIESLITVKNGASQSKTQAQSDFKSVATYMHDRLKMMGKFEDPEPNIKDGTLNVHFIGAREYNGWCFVEFSLGNKLGFDLTKNAVRARFEGMGYNNYIGNDWLFRFDRLPNGTKISSWMMLEKHGICRYNKEAKTKERPMVSMEPFESLELEFADDDALIKDGFRSMSQLRYSSGGPSTFELNITINSTIAKKIAMQNPAFRELLAKRQACVASCQSRMEACALQYSSAQVANQICGLPSAVCLSGCDNLK